jgi:hypothetical protein
MGRKDKSIVELPVYCPGGVSLVNSEAGFKELRFILPSIKSPERHTALQAGLPPRKTGDTQKRRQGLFS